MTQKKLYDVDGVPGEWEEGKLPRIYVKGEWKVYYQLDRFMNNAYPISKADFDQLLAENQASGEG